MTLAHITHTHRQRERERCAFSMYRQINKRMNIYINSIHRRIEFPITSTQLNDRYPKKGPRKQESKKERRKERKMGFESSISNPFFYLFKLLSSIDLD